MRLFLISTLLAFSGCSALAQDFDLSFGGGKIGSLSVSPNRVASNVSAAPMGVGNGTFEATVRSAGGQDTEYTSSSPKKGRVISVTYEGGRATETSVSPSGDMTDMSIASAVPSGVITPVAAINQLISARGCPTAMRFYDGRRVVSVGTTSQDRSDNTLQCNMAYRVTHGPGHLSPLFIKQAALQIEYDVSGSQKLIEMSISSGPFTLYVTP